MLDISEVKKEARKAAYAQRKVAFSGDHLQAQAQLRDRFLETVPLAAQEQISGYRPIRTELDPTPLMLALLERGYPCCVPVVEADATPLSFRRWGPDTEMIPGAFGAEIPADPTEVTPSVLLVPLLAWDRQGYRLGYGGGFYDRTLQKLRAAGPCKAYGIAFAAQEISVVPREATDQPLDGIITEIETLLF